VKETEMTVSTEDSFDPGANGGWDIFAGKLQARLVTAATSNGVSRRVVRALSGESWLGHAAHPAIVMLPAGAFVVSAVYDARAVAGSEQRRSEFNRTADATLVLGLLGAVPAALTGIAQFLGTTGQARRIAALHWALNATAVTAYASSWLLRRTGHRAAGRFGSVAGLTLLGPGAYLGGHLVYRLGVGVAPIQPDRSAR
jgi:uncharacterized membrane protein